MVDPKVELHKSWEFEICWAQYLGDPSPTLEGGIINAMMRGTDGMLGNKYNVNVIAVFHFVTYAIFMILGGKFLNCKI